MQRIVIEALNGGYSPSVLRARAGVPTGLTVRTDGVFGCTRGFVIPSRGLQKVLPETGATLVNLGVLRRAGELPGEPQAFLATSTALYAAAHDAQDATGIYRSTDDGSTWQLRYQDGASS